MENPVRILVIAVALVLAALLLVAFAAEQLQAFNTRGHLHPGDGYATEPLRGNSFDAPHRPPGRDLPASSWGETDH
jgi:hypothetical protein